MHNSLTNLQEIKEEIYSKNINDNNSVKIIAVTKTFKMDKITPLIDDGHIHFGENKVQEAVNKWTALKTSNENLKLHMIGKLQKNKVKHVIPLFDYIHSLDSLELAEKIFIEQKKKNKNLKLFIQVNIGNEKQKGGVNTEELFNFYEICKTKLNLNIIGLMCIPPQGIDINTYFNSMKNLNSSLGLEELSMGMSADYMDAIKHKSTFVRIGSKIFGDRV
jgi:pyridoxal phosphate enzyme (YggS family)